MSGEQGVLFTSSVETARRSHNVHAQPFFKKFVWRTVPLLVFGALIGISAASSTALICVLALFALASTTMSYLEYRWRTYSLEDTERYEAVMFPEPRRDPARIKVEDLHSFTLIVPAFHEEDVIGRTLETLAQQKYPRSKFEVLVTLRDDDHGTISAALEVAQRHPDVIRVYVGSFGGLDNKSTQMNAVLPFARGEFVSPIDAEDIVADELLLYVDAMLHRTKADVVQGGVQLTNLDNKSDGPWLGQIANFVRSGWFAVHNCMEYRAWFTSRLQFQQSMNFVPLGGNTVFIRTRFVIEDGGWNDMCLTEDCDLGIRLSVERGAKIVAAYSSTLATREHTPPRIFGKGSLFKQRVRWDQGFWQVMQSAPWTKLPTLGQRLMAFYILGMPLLQAMNVFLLPLCVSTIFYLHAPLWVALLLFQPFIPMTLTLSLQIMELRAFGDEFDIKVRPRHYVSLMIGYFPYQVLIGVAAIVAIAREEVGIRSWSKTARSKNIHNQLGKVDGAMA